MLCPGIVSFIIKNGSGTLFVMLGGLLECKGLACKKSFRLCLQSMEHTLTQQREFRSTISHAFDQFELVHIPFNQVVVLGKSGVCRQLEQDSGRGMACFPERKRFVLSG